MRSSAATGLAVVLAGVLGIAAIADTAQTRETPGFHEFLANVDAYLKLEKSMPRLRSTKQRGEIVQRRRALAEKIAAARATAKPGDIFTPAASEEFRRVIRGVFEGPKASAVRRTIRQGEPLPGWRLTVNGDYPAEMPLTTVPPTLLLHLPQLPSEVAYRIVGHDFVLEDTEARLIVDFIPGAVP